MASESSPMNGIVLPRMPIFDCTSIAYLPYIRNPESTQRILRIDLKGDNEEIAISNTKGTWILHVTCVVNSCQGKVAGILY